MKHFNEEINLFVDGELESEKQSEMFAHTAECTECRKLFSDLIILKEKSRIFCAENLDEIKNKPKAQTIGKFYRAAFYTSSAAAILLLFLLATAKPKEVLVTKNEVRVDTVFVEKEVSVQKTPKRHITIVATKRKDNSQIKYLDYINSLKTEKVVFNNTFDSKEGFEL
ncbi:MAG: zf-HC2 domain-containing protein [Melioribacteraceae bacterium]